MSVLNKVDITINLITIGYVVMQNLLDKTVNGLILCVLLSIMLCVHIILMSLKKSRADIFSDDIAWLLEQYGTSNVERRTKTIVQNLDKLRLSKEQMMRVKQNVIAYKLDVQRHADKNTKLELIYELFQASA